VNVGYVDATDHLIGESLEEGLGEEETHEITGVARCSGGRASVMPSGSPLAR
jgi:hypothetical protein